MDVDVAFIERAIRLANPNALRLALYHQTGDERLAAIPAGFVPAQNGALRTLRMERGHEELLMEVALDFLTDPDRARQPDPTPEELPRLIELFTGAEPNEEELAFAVEDLAFDQFPHDARWNEGRPDDVDEHMHVTIIGAGVSGLAVSIQLERLGIPHRIIEKRSELGGTWHINRYPDVRVDVPSRMYQFRFVKRHRWTHFFPRGAEIKAYLEQVAADFGVESRISYDTALTSARWDDDAKHWHLTLQGPDGKETSTTNVIVSCVGLFNRPKLPDIPGLDSFEGAMFHTTEWDHSFDETGRRVGLIGTGSTGTQLVPAVAERAEQLTVFQRTPSWVNPIKGYTAAIPPEEHWLYDALPGYWNWLILSTSLDELQLQHLQTMDPEWIANGGRVNERNARFTERLLDFLAEKIPDPELRAKLTPDYAPLARRLVIDNGFYDSLADGDVDLVGDRIDRIVPEGVVTVNEEGEETVHELDLLVLGSGFHVGQYLWPTEYVGRDGTTLEAAWEADGARAHLGLTMPNFPNLFTIYGPNGQARGGSFHSFATAFGRYIGELLVASVESGHASFEVKDEVFRAYNEAMDAEHRNVLWEFEGGGGYYVNQHGRSGVNMPWTQQQYYTWIRHANLDDFVWR